MIRFALLSLAVAASPGLAFAQPDDEPPDTGDEDEVGDDDDDEGAAAETGDATARPAATTPEVPEVNALRRRYFELRDKLFRSRARAASVATALYSTRVQINLEYKSARHYTITRATVRLDGANVFDNTEGVIGQDSAVRFEGYLAPGRHQVTIRIEATGKDDDRFTTATETTMAVIAPAGRDLVINARAADGGDIAYSWQRKTKGTYRLRLDVDVKTIKREGARKGAIKRG
jgi:hypothetical protein